MNVPTMCLPVSTEHMQFLMCACQRPCSQALKVIYCLDHWIPAVWPWNSWTEVISHIGISVLSEREQWLCSVCYWSLSGGYGCIASWAGTSQSCHLPAQSLCRRVARGSTDKAFSSSEPAHTSTSFSLNQFSLRILSAVWRLYAHFPFWQKATRVWVEG